MKNLSYKIVYNLLEKQEKGSLAKEFFETHPADIAKVINDLPQEMQLNAFLVLSNEKASDVLPELHDEVQEYILDKISEDKLINLIDEMDTDEAADILSDLEDDVSDAVLEKIDKEDSDSIKELLTYDEDSAGGLMQAEIIAVPPEMKRDELIEYIRFNYEDVENIYYVYVIDKVGKLIGLLDVAKLLLADAGKTADKIMDRNVISVEVTKDQEEVAHIFRKYDLYVLPVVDKENTLLGRITVDDIIDVIDEEASEDAYKMVGLDSDDKVFTSPLNSVKKRIPWLFLNLFTAMLVSSVVGIFESTIRELSFLAVLMPIVAGLGGNSGTQTLTVITRGIAMGELTIHNTYKALLKEIIVGIVNGIIIGSMAMLIAYLYKGNLMLGAVLGIAMITNMFIAGLCGSMVPIIMKSLKIDPALASSVIITMLTDIGGFASFLGLATLIL